MYCDNRAVARSENPGGLVVLGGENVPPLVEIGLTDLPNIGGGVSGPPGPPGSGITGSRSSCSFILYRESDDGVLTLLMKDFTCVMSLSVEGNTVDWKQMVISRKSSQLYTFIKVHVN